MSRNLQSALGRIQRKLLARVRSVVRRGVLSNSDSSGQGQTLQTKLLADDVADGVEHFEPYGFTSHPPAGAEGLVFAVGGERAHAVGINFGDRGSRLADLEQGEVAMYHPSGSSIVLRNDGSIEAVAAPGQTVNMGGVPPAARAVARVDDPVTVTVPDIPALHAALNAFAPPGAPDGGAALATALASAITGGGTGTGTITAGGIGSTST